MTTRSIITSPREAAALHDGRATAIVRRMEPQPIDPTSVLLTFADGEYRWATEERTFRCPYGRVGDLLEFRETWAEIPPMKPSGYFTNPKWIHRTAWYEVDNDKPTWGGRWKSPAVMPRKHIRTRRVIASIEPIRTAEMTEEQLAAMGGECGIEGWVWYITLRGAEG